MNAKNNKKFILSGLLLVVSTACNALYQILLKGFYGNEYHIAWGNIIFTVICSIVLILYCFLFNRTKLNKTVYYIGFGLFALLSTYLCFLNSVNLLLNGGNLFNLYTMSDFLFLAITIVMIILKAKSSKGLSIIGTVIFGAYALIQTLAVINDLVSGPPIAGYVWLVIDIYLISEFFAFLNIWLAESGKIATKNKASTVVKTPFEDNLVSLKQLYDSGAITEQEYNEKKTEILNKL